MMIVLSSVSMIVLCMEAREACMEGNRSLSRSLEGWGKEPRRLRCRFIYTPVSTVSQLEEGVQE